VAILFRVKLRPRLEIIESNGRRRLLLTIMTNDTEEHIAKVTEDEQYWQDVRDFFWGGPAQMAIKPMWFLYGMKKLPKGFDPYHKSTEWFEWHVKREAKIHQRMELQAPAQVQDEDPAPGPD